MSKLVTKHNKLCDLTQKLTKDKKETIKSGKMMEGEMVLGKAQRPNM